MEIDKIRILLVLGFSHGKTYEQVNVETSRLRESFLCIVLVDMSDNDDYRGTFFSKNLLWGLSTDSLTLKEEEEEEAFFGKRKKEETYLKKEEKKDMEGTLHNNNKIICFFFFTKRQKIK